MEQIRKHPFFYGVDWNAIRNIEAPFIPRLKSITDTSYFPTDELDQVPDEPVGGDTTGANKELAFLGYVDFLRSECPELTFSLLIQLYVQEVHAFFACFLILRHRKGQIPFVWGHQGGPYVFFPFSILQIGDMISRITTAG